MNSNRGGITGWQNDFQNLVTGAPRPPLPFQRGNLQHLLEPRLAGSLENTWLLFDAVSLFQCHFSWTFDQGVQFSISALLLLVEGVETLQHANLRVIKVPTFNSLGVLRK